jgi:hypothetical protein
LPRVPALAPQPDNLEFAVGQDANAVIAGFGFAPYKLA